MTIGEAIYRVMTTQFKKDAKEAHEIVEAAGYVIYKNEGNFHVKNRSTGRDLYIRQSYYGNTLVFNYGVSGVKFDKPESLKVDLIGYLNKPLADHWIEPHDNKAKMKYSTLQGVKSSVEFDSRQIESIRSKIDSLQNDLIWYTERREKDRQRLADLRKEFGLA